MTSSYNWQKVSIRDIGKVITGKTPSTAVTSYFGNDYPFITPSDMNGYKHIINSERGLSQKGAKLLTRNLLPPKSILVSCIGWQMGKVAMTTCSSFTNQQINAIIPNSNIDGDFLYYSLCTRRQELKNLGSVGTRTPILNKSGFENVQVFLPPFPIQHKIASILSAYDDLIENNTRRIAILEEMAQSLYQEWFMRFRFPGHEKNRLVESEIGLIPEGWNLVKLGDIVELAYGKALKAETRNAGTIPVYGSAGIVGYHNESLVGGPGIIVGRKGNVGSVFWSDSNFFPIDTVFYVKSNVCLCYLYYNLKTQNFINNDAAVPGLNRNQAYLQPFLLPSSKILKLFEQYAITLFKQIKMLTQRNANLRRTRDLLLPKLIAGEIDVENLDIETGTEISKEAIGI